VRASNARLSDCLSVLTIGAYVTSSRTRASGCPDVRACNTFVQARRREQNNNSTVLIFVTCIPFITGKLTTLHQSTPTCQSVPLQSVRDRDERRGRLNPVSLIASCIKVYLFQAIIPHNLDLEYDPIHPYGPGRKQHHSDAIYTCHVRVSARN
jgi:hypothetical protein